jgi:hypothetical protein
MRIGGQWVGLGPGDSSAEVQKIKAYMRGKFRSYAGGLADTPVYDAEMAATVAEMQRRYKLTPTGIVDTETKYRMGYLNKRAVLFTVCGSGVPWWIGPDADTARAVEAQIPLAAGRLSGPPGTDGCKHQ